MSAVADQTTEVSIVPSDSSAKGNEGVVTIQGPTRRALDTLAARKAVVAYAEKSLGLRSPGLSDTLRTVPGFFSAEGTPLKTFVEGCHVRGRYLVTGQP